MSLRFAQERPLGWAAATLGLLALGSLFVGVSALTQGAEPNADALMLVAESRLPRTLAAMLSGSGLAIAGLVMQTMARNRFVEPTTAGTMQGAALGVLLTMILAPDASVFGKTLMATASALAVTSIFMTTVHRLPPTQPFLIPLFGLVYGGVIGAAVTFIAWQTDMLQLVEIWVTGEFSGVLRGRYELLWLSAACVAVAWWVADRLTIVSLGREASIGLGVNYAGMLRIGLVIVAAVSATTVVVVGAIPFVGLVAPAIVSRIAGDNLRSTIPLVAVVGATLVLGCDIIGRLVRYPYEIPAGTVCGVVGALAFLVILLSRARND